MKISTVNQTLKKLASRYGLTIFVLLATALGMGCSKSSNNSSTPEYEGYWMEERDFSLSEKYGFYFKANVEYIDAQGHMYKHIDTMKDQKLTRTGIFLKPDSTFGVDKTEFEKAHQNYTDDYEIRKRYYKNKNWSLKNNDFIESSPNSNSISTLKRLNKALAEAILNSPGRSYDARPDHTAFDETSSIQARTYNPKSFDWSSPVQVTEQNESKCFEPKDSFNSKERYCRMNHRDSVEYCKSIGKRLPTAYEMVDLARQLGATGIVNYHELWETETMVVRNGDGTAETFEFKKFRGDGRNVLVEKFLADLDKDVGVAFHQPEELLTDSCFIDSKTNKIAIFDEYPSCITFSIGSADFMQKTLNPFNFAYFYCVK